MPGRNHLPRRKNRHTGKIPGFAQAVQKLRAAVAMQEHKFDKAKGLLEEDSCRREP